MSRPHDATVALDKGYASRDNELTGIKGNRDDKARELEAMVTRFRSAIRGVFGPDSVQYERAGGVRLSARKAPTRKAKAGSVTTTAAAPSA